MKQTDDRPGSIPTPKLREHRGRSGRRLSVLVFALILCGCFRTSMRRVRADAVSPPPPGRAVVVFTRPTTVTGGKIRCSVFEIVGDNETLVGVLGPGMKVAYVTDPGEHMFMVVSEAADFMKATLLPGKTYCTVVHSRMGLLKPRFSFHPLRSDRSDLDEFASCLTGRGLFENTDESLAWARGNAPDIHRKHKAFLSKWTGKPSTERDEQTLRPEDGR